MFRIDADKLRPLLHARLAALDVDPAGAGHVVDSLLQTSLRGVDSHGIQLFPHYVRAVAAGRVIARPTPVLERTAASTARLDANHAFGHHAGALAIDAAVDIARETGLGAVSVHDSTHFGAAAYFALRAADADMVGFSFTNADALVKAFNAREPVFGTNPVCFAAPMRDEGPLCLDMATSLVSWNKVRNARVAGTALGADWAFDRDGLPTTDANAAASLNPAGGYKGYGLGMMVEVLCGLLADGPVAHELLPMFTSPIEVRRHLSHFFLALDIGRFVPVDRFRSRLQHLADGIRAMELTQQGATQPNVMVPGDPEKRAAVERTRDGIPAAQALLDAFAEVDVPLDGALRR
jgi:ureidoglycolate dehydrogenase (NAD+)